MKPLLSLIFATVMAGSAVAGNLKIINIGAATSPTAVYVNSYAKNLNLTYEFLPTKSCKDAVQISLKSDSVVVLVNDVFLQAAKLGQACFNDVRLKPENVIFTSSAYFEVCKKTGSEKTLKTPGVIVGRASVHPIKEWEYDFNKQNNTSVKGVGFSGSKTVLAAVLNGDADWGVIAREIATPAIKDGRIECPYNTEANGDRSLSKHFDMIHSEYVLSYMLIANTKDPALLKTLKKAASDPKFLAYVKTSEHININTNPGKSEVDAFFKTVDDLSELLKHYKENK